MKHQVKQIVYDSWLDPDAPRHYWADIHWIALFLAKSLAGSYDPEHRLTTIKVHFYKEKFGMPLVDCTLADTNLVSESFATCMNASNPISMSFEAHHWMCLRHDVGFYRNAYESMIDLVPHYKKVIVDGSNYPELLCNKRKVSDYVLSYGDTQVLRQRWNASDDAELTKILSKLLS